MAVKIKDRILDLPIIQGGMGVGISLGKLAGSVAKYGAMGTISMVDIGYREEDFWKNPRQANIRAYHKEVERAREISKGRGLIATNIMAAVEDYDYLIKEILESDVDVVVVGAGLALDLPEHNTKCKLLAPIVSSARALKILGKKWLRNFDVLPDFVVLEGRGAGGHLGFSREDMDDEKLGLENLTKELVDLLKEFKDKYKKTIPLFVAGSVMDHDDLKRFQDLGADGIQVGTRFIATHEADAHQNMKEAIVKAKKEDIALIDSPAGFLGRALDNDFIKRTRSERVPPKKCINCLSPCNPKTTQYCITDALIATAEGRLDEGLVFCGSRVDEIEDIKSVKEVLEDLTGQDLGEG